MINLLMALGLLAVLLAVNKFIYHYPTWPKLLVIIVLSLSAGLFMDYIFGYRMGLWSYVHHKWWSPDYFYNLIPAWTMVLSIFILFYSLLENAVKNINIRMAIYFTVVCGQQEFMGLWRQSWEYNAPLWLIIIGWILLLECCIVAKKVIDFLGTSMVEIKYYSREVSQSESR